MGGPWAIQTAETQYSTVCAVPNVVYDAACDHDALTGCRAC